MTEHLEGHKPAITSKTIVTCIVGAVTILGAFGVKLAVDDPEIESIANGVMAASSVFFVLAGYFRKTATHKVGSHSGINYAVPLLLVLVAGCMTRAEHAAKIEVIERSVRHQDDEYLEWARSLANLQPQSLPNLTNDTPQQRAAWLRARERRVEERNAVFDQAREQGAE